MIGQLHIHKRFYIIGGILLLLSYMVNMFGVGPSSRWFNNFEDYSEQLPLQTIQCASDHDYHGNLSNPPGHVEHPIPVYPTGDRVGCFVYPSQFGLQGFVYAAIPSLTHSPKAQELILFGMKVILVSLMAVMMLAFVFFVQREFGRGVAAVVLGLLVLSPWPAAYARNLYWVSFLLFAPFIASLYLYPLIRRSRHMSVLFMAVVGGLLFVKFLTGYEYFTTIVVSAFVPMVYWELRTSSNFKQTIQTWLRRGVVLAAVAVAAFGLSFGLTVISLADDYGSVGQAYAAIKQRGEVRTNAGISYGFAIVNFHNTQPQLYDLINQHAHIDRLADGTGSPLVYTALLLVNYAAQPVVSLPITLSGLLPLILQSFLFWMCLGIWAMWWLQQRKLIEQRTFHALSASMVLSLLGILSWGVVARGFVFEHVHITPITFYLPFVLFAYCAVGVAVWHCYRLATTGKPGPSTHRTNEM